MDGDANTPKGGLGAAERLWALTWAWSALGQKAESTAAQEQERPKNSRLFKDIITTSFMNYLSDYFQRIQSNISKNGAIFFLGDEKSGHPIKCPR